ncbi:Uu.00g038010.m01.CDS01 [Anthostomella pinea]|uniref:Uu.00g038010.m01.CDS01 n=1 Tax=Anthostomella pinea TaxID=933095 RepID=A0AAI8V4T6_9PEZI|nr:Uu.00g038010.m01.CDS01 [Anthostomella pinea]
MASQRVFAATQAHLRMVHPRIERHGKALSQGAMIGTAIAFPVVQNQGRFYYYLTLSIFLLSTLIYNALMWRAVVRYFFLSLVVVGGPPTILLVNPDVSMTSSAAHIPLLIMLMSLVIHEFSRLQLRPLGGWHLLPESSPGTPGSFLSRSLLLDKGLLDVESQDEYMSNAPFDHKNPLLDFMEATAEHDRLPSQRSSDITLSSGEPGSLPSSWGSSVRNFFPHYSDQRNRTQGLDHEPAVPRRETA